MSASVRLAPLDHERFASWRTSLIEHYADDKVVSGAWRGEDAVRLSTEAVDQLLPGGPETPDHLLFAGLDDDDREVGTLWLFVDRSGADGPAAFVYDIEVDAGHRRQGFGRALLAAGEDHCRGLGVTRVGLHVFGHNQAAVALYLSTGYEVTDYSMRKAL